MGKKFRRFERRFRKSLDYLKDSKRYIYFVALLFVLGGVVGFLFANSFSFIESFLREIIERVSKLGAFDLIAFIFQNNVMSAFYGLIFGIVLGIFPVISAISNGIVLGFVLNGAWRVSGFSSFWRILPHGIFELVAVFIALGLGVKLGMFIFEKDKGKAIRERLINSLIIFVMIVIPLLVLAAIIEGLLIIAL